ncbi:hypothetical protein F5Y19DRAFT_367393 [Xylariaceae sp. FL1651]|nr:hypothetical protein F5Y19DRAFT_367393 [Xylariaceae sp. FL1651]
MVDRKIIGNYLPELLKHFDDEGNPCADVASTCALDCLICREELAFFKQRNLQNHSWTYLPCGHIFGFDCLLTWAHTTPPNDSSIPSPQCPSCRKSMRHPICQHIIKITPVSAANGSIFNVHKDIPWQLGPSNDITPRCDACQVTFENHLLDAEALSKIRNLVSLLAPADFDKERLVKILDSPEFRASLDPVRIHQLFGQLETLAAEKPLQKSTVTYILDAIVKEMRTSLEARIGNLLVAAGETVPGIAQRRPYTQARSLTMAHTSLLVGDTPHQRPPHSRSNSESPETTANWLTSSIPGGVPGPTTPHSRNPQTPPSVIVGSEVDEREDEQTQASPISSTSMQTQAGSAGVPTRSSMRNRGTLQNPRVAHPVLRPSLHRSTASPRRGGLISDEISEPVLSQIGMVDRETGTQGTLWPPLHRSTSSPLLNGFIDERFLGSAVTHYGRQSRERRLLNHSRYDLRRPSRL